MENKKSNEERLDALEKKEKQRQADFEAVFQGIIIALGLFMLFGIVLASCASYNILKEIFEVLRSLGGA